MSYTKNYNTRHSRYSTSGNGQFGGDVPYAEPQSLVPAYPQQLLSDRLQAEHSTSIQQSPLSSQNSQMPSYQAVGQRKQQVTQPPKAQQPLTPQMKTQQPMAPKPSQITPQPQPPQAAMPQQTNSNLKNIPIESEDVEMQPASEEFDNSASNTGETPQRPHWMKSKLAGVKKVSNKERRRRQNENLRRLLTPKNALMVLNEMMPGEQVNNQFKVEPAGVANQYYGKPGQQSFCADLTINGNTYKGYGDNKLSARNLAAEQAIRDLIIQKMNKFLSAEGHDVGTEEGEEPLPMIQLASFALHKLFSEWEYEGHKVPQLKPSSNSVSESGSEIANTLSSPRAPKPMKKKDLPLNAADMHPCMLLTYMRPVLEYKELAVDGDRPQNMVFTMGVEVDGSTYIGKAANKKEARKQAAKAACTALFGVRFNENPSENTPKVQA